MLLLLQCLTFGLFTFGQVKNDSNYTNLKKKINSYVYNIDSLNHHLPKLIKAYKSNHNKQLERFYYEINAKKFSVLITNSNNNLDSLVYYYTKCIQFGIKNKLDVSRQIHDLSYEHIALCKVEEALKYTEENLKYYNLTKIKKSKSNYFNQKAMIYSYCLNKYDSAIHYYNLNLIDFRENKDSASVAITLENIGMAYLELKEYKASLKHFKEALELEMKIQSLAGEYFCKSQMAKAYYALKKCKLSEKYLLESLEYYKQTKNKVRQSECSQILSNTYVILGDYSKAKKYIELALSRFSPQDNSPSLLSALETKSRILYENKEYQESIDVLNIAIEKNKSTNTLIYNKRFYGTLYQCESKLGHYERAFFLLKKYNKLKDSLNANQQKVNIKEVEEKYENEKKIEELKLLKSKQMITEQKQKRKTNFLMGAIVLSLVIGSFLFLLYKDRLKVNKKLKEIDKLKTKFFENISHEFRTPLTLIKLPLGQAIKSNQELGLKELNMMHNNASRLQNLIEDLLSLSELEAGKTKINKTEQDPLHQSKVTSSQFDSYAESKGIDYQKIIEHNTIQATYDKSVVEKALANLISNAIKYSERGEAVQVSVSVVDQKLIMMVSDSGQGISPEDQEKIFERFYRAVETDEGRQGSGIGLALVKKMLEINGGTIEVTSEINEGSTFTATLPLENVIQLPFESKLAEEKKKTLIQPEAQDLLDEVDISDKPQLLITEDSKELLEYISTLFKKDFQIIQARDGEEGMQKALEYVPDFIVSDWMMPKKNGLEFCSEVKTNTITSHIPFLLLTAKSTVEYKIEGYETGADAYFSKPFNFNELKSRINGLLKQRQLLYEKFNNSDIQPFISTNNSLDVAFWEEFKLYLKNNIRQSELNATQIAAHMGMSRMQLHRKLTTLTGQNLSTFIKNQRMNLAADLLKDSSNRISDVCYEIGYEDQSAFARAFKKEYGVSPTKYREKLTPNNNSI